MTPPAVATAPDAASHVISCIYRQHLNENIEKWQVNGTETRQIATRKANIGCSTGHATSCKQMEVMMLVQDSFN